MRYPTKDFVVAVLCAALISCSGDPSAPAIAPVASLTLAGLEPTLIVGAITTLTAETVNASGQVMRGRNIEFASSNPAVASVAPLINTAKITAVAQGTATISASSEGKTAAITVTVNAPPLCADNELLSMTVGQTVTLSAAQKAFLCVGASTAAADYKLVIVNTVLPSSVTLNGDNTVAVPLSTQDLVPASALFVHSTNDMAWTKSLSVKTDFDVIESPVRAQTRRLSPPLESRKLRTSELPAVGSLVPINGLGDGSCTAFPRFGRVVHVGRNIIMYADAELTSDGFSDAQYASLAATFDTLVYPLDTLNFGSPRDLDGNGRIGVYFLPGPQSGEIAGTVAYRDFEQTSACVGSNAGEFMYLTLPNQ